MTTMSLAEAIRLGALLKPQAFHGPVDLVSKETVTCALAAAAEAIGLARFNRRADLWLTWFGSMEWQRSHCPACRSYNDIAVTSLVIHLNDDHRWTRERIADWVDVQERTVRAGQEVVVVATTRT